MLSVLLNNTLQPAPPSTNQTKELSTLHAPKPTGGGIWTTGVGLKEWPRRKIFFAKNKKPLVPKEKLTRGDKPIL